MAKVVLRVGDRMRYVYVAIAVVVDGGVGSGCGSFAHTFVKSLTTPNQELATTLASLCALTTLRIVRLSSSFYPPTFNASSNAVSRLDELLIRSIERNLLDNVSCFSIIFSKFFS